jgi:hypothetical protein
VKIVVPAFAGVRDDVAKVPSGAPFALNGPGGQTILFGTRLVRRPAPVAPSFQVLAKASAVDTAKTMLMLVGAAFGASPLVDAAFSSWQTTEKFGATSSPSPSGQPRLLTPAFSPELQTFLTRLETVQEARRHNPGTAPEVLEIGDATVNAMTPRSWAT